MIIYGKTKTELAEKIGVTKQALCQRIQRHPEALNVNVEEARYELDTDKIIGKVGSRAKNINYKKNYIISGSKSQTVPKIFLNNKISVQNDIFRLILKFFKN